MDGVWMVCGYTINITLTFCQRHAALLQIPPAHRTLPPAGRAGPAGKAETTHTCTNGMKKDKTMKVSKLHRV